MLNPEKVVTVIKHVAMLLEKQDVYKLACNLENAELVELRKHYDVSVEDGFGDFDNKYVFTKKK